MNLETLVRHVASEAPVAALIEIDQAVVLDFQQIVEQAEVGICITQDGRLQYANRKFAELHGHTAVALQGTDYVRIVHPDERERVDRIRRLRESGQHHAPYESRQLRADGSSFDSRVFGRSISYCGRPASLVTLSDISEIANAQRLSAWRARMLVSNELLCRSGSIEIDLERQQVRLSTGARRLMAHGDAAGATTLAAALRCIPAEDRAAVLAQWRAARPGVPFEFRHWLRRSDGSLLRVLHRGLVEIAEDEGRDRPVAILQDVTEQAEAEARIDQLLNYHPVTGLATRGLLLQRTAAAIELARHEARPLVLLCLRVPDLGRLHDALGLSGGDAMASELATRLVHSCRSEDTVAQIGSHEFAILLDPLANADASNALATARRVLAAVGTPAAVHSTEVSTEGRIGIALFPGDAADAQELLEHAHAACGGGDTGIQFFTREAGEKAMRRIRLEAALRRALERGELCLHYQPQVDLHDGSIADTEALLRWHGDEFGTVSPAEFIPIAEECGLIGAIGEWVFRSACEQSAAWARAGLPPVRIGVNLSPRQLEQPDISQRLQSILLDTGAEPTHLGIEVTESMVTRDLEHARRTLHELSAIGIEIALDDFGTGYSNLSVLRALPFDVLKIDRSLVHDVTAAPEDVSITRAVLMLAQGLKLKVLAEGVETEGQLNLLIGNGCDLMQGYIFSQPLPADAMESLLREGRRLPDRFLTRQQRQRTLLLVDDEDNVLSSLRRLLRSEGYHIVIARSGPEGLAKLAEHDVDVIVSDQRMPGMTGVEFLRRAKELYPDTVRMVLSGYTELQSITDAVNEGAIYKFLTKPWDDERLRAHIAEAFRRKGLSDENHRLAAELGRANLELAQANERQELLLARQREQLSLEECRALNAQELLHHLPTAVIGIDAEGSIAFVNEQARELMSGLPLMLGFPAEQALPPEWRAVWQGQDGRPRRVEVGGRRHLLSCATMKDRGVARGHLLSIHPDLDAWEGPAP